MPWPATAARTESELNAWNNGGMPEKPTPSADDLVRMLFQFEATVSDAQVRQMLDRLSQQTYVGGKRLAIEKLPRLPKQAATRVPGRTG
jgi:hypothetical protein